MARSVSPNRILVLCSARIGDTLLFTPCLNALKHRFPQAHLEVWAHPKRQALLQGLDFIDALRNLNPWRRLMARLRPKAFDLAVVYGDGTQLLQLAQQQAHQVVAFSDKPSSSEWITVARPSAPEHAVWERLRLAQAVGADSQDWRLSYRVSSGEQQWAERWWRQQQLLSVQPVIGIQVASFPTKAYRDWPVEHFEALLSRVFQHYPQAKILVLGDKASHARGQMLVQRFPRQVLNTAGQFDLRQNAAIMARLSLYIGVDTGPTHLAGALQLPMVALYHPRHPGALLAPLQHPALRVIEHPQAGLSQEPEIPMSEIEPEQVWQAVDELLNRSV